MRRGEGSTNLEKIEHSTYFCQLYKLSETIPMTFTCIEAYGQSIVVSGRVRCTPCLISAGADAPVAPVLNTALLLLLFGPKSGKALLTLENSATDKKRYFNP